MCNPRVKPGSAFPAGGGRSRVQLEVQAWECILRRVAVVHVSFVRWQSGKDESRFFHFSWSANLAYSIPSNRRFVVLIAAFPTRRTWPVNSLCGAVEGGICDARVRIVCKSVSSTPGIVFKPSVVQSLTAANQRKTLTRILSPCCMWRIPSTESRYSFY